MGDSLKPKILVIGLDSVPSELLFKKLADTLPNIKHMMETGIYTTLESCHPPITVPAWMVMMSSKSPGKLGVYGFRHRKGFSYTEGWLTNSQTIKEPRVWDYLAKEDKKVCLVGVPPTYPPIQVNGKLVSCFITPKDKDNFTHPPELSQEIQSLVDKYIFDVKFRTDNRDEIIKNLYEMTEKRFEVIKHMIKKENWDFFMFVEIGVDRLHHMFWKYYDEEHPRYEPGNKYENVIPDYYKYIDGKIGELLSIIDDNTFVLLVSDHGTASMKGAFCINEWLIKEGYLVLKNYPKSISEIEKCDVDWEKTTAWGWGGYYARIFFNVKGRETQGRISPSEFDKVRDELKQKIISISGPNGEKFANKVLYPDELYGEARGSKPDMMVYFDDLYWRSAGTIGHNSLYLSENDTGPDDSVHWMDGVFLLYHKKKAKCTTRLERLSIYDVAPTILDIMKIPVPQDMEGKISYDVSNWVHGKRKIPAIWMTGLPCSGKTTIARKLQEYIPNLAVLDGDELREWFSPKDFSKEGRNEHNRKVAHLAKLLLKHNVPAAISLVSPYRENREDARKIIGNENFLEIFVKCSLNTCEKRDVKGMYKKARNNEIKNFTGIQDPYEEPLKPDLIINTDEEDLQQSVDKVLSLLGRNELVSNYKP